MNEEIVLNYTIQDPKELNLSYIPFIEGGGIFIPTRERFRFGEVIQVNLKIPGESDVFDVKGKIVWITPLNALHHVLPGIGIQFIGENANLVKQKVEANLDKNMDMGGYV